jgi:hypothetical protein
VGVEPTRHGNGFALDWPRDPPDPAVRGGHGLRLVHQMAEHVLLDAAKGRLRSVDSMKFRLCRPTGGRRFL